MKRSFVLFATLALVLAATPLLADAGTYHWKGTAPFTLDVGDSVGSNWDANLTRAASDWSGSSALDLAIVSGAGRPRTCPGQTGRIEVCAAKYGTNGWYSVASIWLGDGHINKATVKLNDTYLDGTPDSTRQTLLCSEMGYTLGLVSGGPDPSCMNLNAESPSNYDYLTLDAIYNHTHLKAAPASPRPPAMDLLRQDGPGQWGELVARSESGLTELYLLDFGGGHRIVTFVTWAD